MTILVTGSAGFIGSALVSKLLSIGEDVIGIDNHNSYYDPKLKEARINRFIDNSFYRHLRIDLTNKDLITRTINTYKPDYVVNLAAQAGVRNSIQNPHEFINSNVVGFLNLLDSCKDLNIKHFVYASSSSVYGANTKIPFSVLDNVDHPINVYAASKKSNELLAHCYSHLYKIPTTGLRFFTVYGPWGRPDMALYKFTKSIFKGKEIDIFNYGKHKRDFTYIDDIIEVLMKVINKPAKPVIRIENKNTPDCSSFSPYRIFNVGNNNPVNLMSYIKILEECIGIKAKIKLLPMQPGEIDQTYANVDDLIENFNYKPSTSLEVGISNFVTWYKDYHEL